MTPEQQQICKKLAEGFTAYMACISCGVLVNDFCKWLTEAPEFLRSVLKAENQGKERLFDVILNSALNKKDWQAAAWILERGCPEKFGSMVNLNFPVNKPVINKSLN